MDLAPLETVPRVDDIELFDVLEGVPFDKTHMQVDASHSPTPQPPCGDRQDFVPFPVEMGTGFDGVGT